MSSTLPDPAALLADAPRVGAALGRAGWSVESVDELLGATARTHLDRDELAPVLRRASDGSPLATLARLFVVGVPVSADAAHAAGVPPSWLRPDGTAAIRLQAVEHGGVEVTVPHDAGRAATGVHPDQVLGVGAASLTLAAATPRRRVERALDLGTGCGIQALLAEDHATTVLATDRNPRAVAFARLAAALAGVEIDTREGDLLAPVEGELFDLRRLEPAVRREPHCPLHLPRRGTRRRRGVPAARTRPPLSARAGRHRCAAGQLAARRRRGR